MSQLFCLGSARLLFLWLPAHDLLSHFLSGELRVNSEAKWGIFFHNEDTGREAAATARRGEARECSEKGRTLEEVLQKTWGGGSRTAATAGAET